MISRRFLRFVTAALIMSMLLTTGCSRYPALLAEWEKAEPPAYLRQNSPADLASRPPLPTPLPPPKTRPGPEPPAEPGPDLSFFSPDPALLKELAPAAIDADFAAARLAKGLTLADFEALVLLRNPDLRAAEEEFQAVVERYSQTESLNNLLSRYAALIRGLETGVGAMAPGTDNAGLYPFPGLISLRGDIVGQEVAAAHELRAITRREVLAAARRAFWELFYTRQAHAIAIRNYDVVDSLKNTSAAGYAAGTGSFVDLVRVDMEHGLMKEAIPIQLEEVRLRETAMRALLDLPLPSTIGDLAQSVPGRELPTPAELEKTALTARQELRLLRAQITKTEVLIAMAEAETHPGYSLNFSTFPAKDAARILPGEERPDSFPTTVPAADGLGTPRNAFYGLNEGYLRETRRTLAGLRYRLAAEEANTRSLVQGAWYQLAKAHREERLYRDKVVPLARTDLDTTTSAYEAGRITFAGMLDVYSRWFAATLAWQRAQADLGVAWAGLEESVGARIGGEEAFQRSNVQTLKRSNAQTLKR